MSKRAATNSKTLNVIEGNGNTGEIVAKRGIRNALIVCDVLTCQLQTVSTAILYTDNMDEESALKVLQAWWSSKAGYKFAAWMPIDDFKECTTNSNFGLSESEHQPFLFNLLNNMGLQSLVKKALSSAMKRRAQGDKFGQQLFDLL